MSENTETAPSTSTCPDCGGRKFRYVEGQAGVVPCECQQRERPGRLLAGAGIPPKYENCRLDNYVAPPNNPYLAAAHSDAISYANAYLKTPMAKGLLFQGPPGRGKTHLAIGIMHRLIEGSVSCFFCNFAGELQKIRESIGEDRSLNLPRLVYDADVLILDDFGQQRWSAWVQDHMSNVISNRYNEGRATIITTNLTDRSSKERQEMRIAAMKKLGVMNHSGEIDKFQLARLEQLGIRFVAPHDEPETLEDQIGDRLRSRLFEMCQIIPMWGDDYRRTLAEQRRDILRR